MKPRSQSANQVVGNVGLYYVCYRLSRLGWNVMPTARNAKGIDVLIYSQDAKRTRSVQVKALSKKVPVPLGAHTDGLIGDFFVVCCNVASDDPECFVLTPAEVQTLAHRGVKDDKNSTDGFDPTSGALVEGKKSVETSTAAGAAVAYAVAKGDIAKVKEYYTGPEITGLINKP